MTVLSLSCARPAAPLSRFWREAPGYTALGLMLTLGLIPLGAAAMIDTRLFQGDPVWLKPAKFHLALAIYVLTLAFYARYLRPPGFATRAWRGYNAVVIAAVIYETLWIGIAAAYGTASHFNADTPAWIVAYAAAGVGAVTLTSASLVMGIAIWRNRDSLLPPALRLGLALGLILTFVLTVMVAGYLSSNNGHFVGTPTTGAALPILGWSREVGDLRAPHFFATHALHGVPLAALLAHRLIPTRAVALTWAAAAAYAALVLGLFAQALMGLPVI